MTWNEDYLRIFDGDSYRREKRIVQLNAYNLPSDVLSFDSTMLVVFDADEPNNWAWKGQGFKARISFEEANTSNTTNACTTSNPCQINQGHCHYDGQCSGALRCGNNNCPQELGYPHGTNCCYDYCGQFLDLNSGKLEYYEPNGIGYDDMDDCSWQINVAPKQIINLEFIVLKVSFHCHLFIFQSISTICIFKIQVDNHYSFDYIHVFDGNASKENNALAEITGVYGINEVYPSNISSSSNQLLVTFVSDERRNHQYEGFKAKIHTALNHKMFSADDCTVAKPCPINQGHCQSDDECQGVHKCGHNNCPANLGYHPEARCCYDYCSQWLDMENGILTSAWYPKQYPKELRCNTLITVGMTVSGPRTITLEFLKFKVGQKSLQI